MHSVRSLVWGALLGGSITALALLTGIYLWTGSWQAVLGGVALTAAGIMWGLILLKGLERRLSAFSEGLCQTIEDMILGRGAPAVPETETVFARISAHLRQLYRAMEDNRHRAEQDRQELQALLSDISHQTKTPIANLKMLNDTMLDRPMEDPQRRQFLIASGKQLGKLEFLIAALVKSSRLETGMITLEKQEAPVSDTIALALSGVLGQMEQKQITFTVDCSETLTVNHDVRWTAEAISNLLDNAVKYTPQGGSIHVAAEAWEMYVKILVRDTGRGIPEQEQATIFRRFYREAAVHDTEGVGIGLYLTREIITRQGGYVTVASRPGQGATFSLFLPRR